MKINSLPSSVHSAANKFKLLKLGEKFSSKKITDGVSSDIWHIKTKKNTEFCIKRALDKLTVKEDWFAPVSRSNFEAMYFKYCKKVMPECFPKLLGHDNKNYILAMQWYSPKSYRVWKKKLLNSNINFMDAINISNVLIKKHKFFFHKKFYKKKFENDDTFYSIRIEPYIIFTSNKYPQYKKKFLDVAQSLVQNKKTLIHGDFSPKNILIKSNNPIILDAETACWGDPVFDLAFCNNHILLKSLLFKNLGHKFLELSYKFLNNYIKNITWEDKNFFIQRLIKILPLLLLARVDGKSPVEYFKTKEKKQTRSLAKNILNEEVKNIQQLFSICNNYV